MSLWDCYLSKYRRGAMEHILEFCWHGMAAFLFCFALSFAMVQLKQEGRMLKTLKETTTIEQDMGTYGEVNG